MFVTYSNSRNKTQSALTIVLIFIASDMCTDSNLNAHHCSIIINLISFYGDLLEDLKKGPNINERLSIFSFLIFHICTV
jgi:hypothetical protein